MAYYIDLFSPETYDAFKKSNQNISGFRERQRNIAATIKPGDKLICYVTQLSRFFGVLLVESTFYKDASPIFYAKNDPFVIRFKVQVEAWLDFEKSPSIKEDLIWNKLAFTKEHVKSDHRWTMMVRGSLRKLTDEDGIIIETILKAQKTNGILFPLTDVDMAKLERTKITTSDEKEITVSIPEDITTEEEPTHSEAIRIQAKLAEIGEKMHLRIWIPKNNRSQVLNIWKPIHDDTLLDKLPLNYNEATLKTIEQIDVIWIKRSAIIRAFEVEHTTAIYSGILRMADLMALQPNTNINAHIVAPLERREKVFEEITRPVFSTLEKGPLVENCTFLSYDSIDEISEIEYIEHVSDSIIDEYAEDAII